MSQIPEPSPNAAQSEYWNAVAGETWAQFQEPLDRQIEPLGLAGIDVLQPVPGEHIIDIGCGCGQTSLALAARVAPSGSVVGIDLSRPMLEVARRRPRPAANLRVDFRQLDAQNGDIGRGVFDAAFSRFGVMFFSDPVAAFSEYPRILEARRPSGLRLLATARRESVDAGAAASRASIHTACCAARSDGAWAVCLRRREPRALDPELTRGLLR